MILSIFTRIAPNQQQLLLKLSRAMSSASSTNPQSALEVVHNKRKHEFYINLDPPDKGILQYDILSNGSVDMFHTGVPQTYRGRGIAGQLAKAALSHFTNEKTKMILTCTYLQKYYHDHPDASSTDLISLPS